MFSPKQSQVNSRVVTDALKLVLADCGSVGYTSLTALHIYHYTKSMVDDGIEM